jgi:hypothetical protein
MELTDRRRVRFAEPCECDSDERNFHAQFHDLSLDGAYIGTHEPFPVGHRFRLRFAVQGRTLVLPCIVRHTNPGTGMGVKFLNITPEERELLARYLERLVNRLGDTAHAKKRTASRLSIRIPVLVSGLDSLGKTFEEDTETLNVSERGACIRLRQPVLPGTNLKLKIGLGPQIHVAEFRVVWVGPSDSPTAGQVGLTPTVLDLWRAWAPVT